MVVVQAILSGTPPTSLWAILQQLQMVIVLVMIDTYTPSDIDDYLEGVSFAIFNFNFIPLKKIPGLDIPVDWMDSAQPIDKLEVIGLESRSTFVNNVSFLGSLLLLFSIHLILKYVKCPKVPRSQEFAIERWSAKFRSKAIDLIFYVMYARLFLEAHEGMMLS